MLPSSSWLGLSTSHCRGDACPVYLGQRYLDWELDGSAGKPLEDVRPIGDEIGRRVQGLLAELVNPAPPPQPVSKACSAGHFLPSLAARMSEAIT